MCTEAELRAIVDLAGRRGCYLLVDETYRDLSYDTVLPLAASLGICGSVIDEWLAERILEKRTGRDDPAVGLQAISRALRG